MDAAYDRIQEEVTSPTTPGEKPETKQETSLSSEFQEAYKAFSTSSWGASLGGFLGSVRTRGESIVQGARQEFLGEYNAASSQASKSYDELQTQLENATEKVTLNTQPPSNDSSNKDNATDESTAEKPENLGADIVKEAESMLSRFRSEASKRLKDIEKAEDAADEALLKFGTNIRNFLRDAVSITAPEDDGGDGRSQVLFESKDAEGKRVIHTTRFDAQLHVIHSSLDSFLKDPSSPEYEKWAAAFDVEKNTEAVARDLEKYQELRRAMEKLVPEKVEYGEFWKRYYFLRHVIETEEAKRREMLKGAATGDDEEIAWDEDSDDETSTPNPHKTKLTSASQTTLQAVPSDKEAAGDNPDLLKPAEGRRSNDEKSQADSDASYDIVSGAPSRASGSPKEKKSEPVKEESDEEDWE